MKPPICVICRKNIKNMEEGGLIRFAKTDKDRAWDKRVQKEKIIGHPPYAEWFCEDHYPIARKYRDEPKSVALPKIRNKLKLP